MTSNDAYVEALTKIERGEWPESQVKRMALSPVSLLAAVAYGDFPKAVELLLKHGASVNATNRGGQTPLHFAAGHDRLPAVRILLGANADPNAKDKDGRTPLHVSVQRGNGGVTRALLEHGADVDSASKSGVTPLKIAEARGALVDELRAFCSEDAKVREFARARRRKLSLRRDRRLERAKMMSERAHGPTSSEFEVVRRVARSTKRICREHDERMHEVQVLEADLAEKKKREREARECIVTDDDVDDDDE